MDLSPEEEEFQHANQVLEECLLELSADATVPEVRALVDDPSSSTPQLFKMDGQICAVERVRIGGAVVEELVLQSFAVSLADVRSGGARWGGSVALARHLSASPGLVAGKSVLELGAGSTGVPGLVASCCGARQVVLTDSLPKLVETLGRNVSLNRVLVQRSGVKDISTECLDWTEISARGVGENALPSGAFDVVLGSELIWAGVDPRPLVQAIGTLLCEQGVALILMPIGGRGAEALFIASVRENGLALETTRLPWFQGEEDDHEQVRGCSPLSLFKTPITRIIVECHPENHAIYH